LLTPDSTSCTHNRMQSLLPMLLVLAASIGAVAQSSDAKAVPRGVEEVQVPFRSLRPSATIKLGATADWVLASDLAVWVGSGRPNAVQRIDPATNRVVAKVKIGGEACSGLAFGFGSVWVPVCGKKAALVRIDASKNSIVATIPVPPAGPEGGIATSADSVWMVTDKNGTLVRIDPTTNQTRQKISIPSGSFNPHFSEGVVWVTGVENNLLIAVDAATGEVVASIPVGPRPRFLTSGAGSVWTLNQGDGTVSRVDEKSKRVVATIEVGTPGTGGDVAFGNDFIWTTVLNVPLTRINTATNAVVRQWVGPGGDSLAWGFGSLWLTDYRRGLVLRIPFEKAP